MIVTVGWVIYPIGYVYGYGGGGDVGALNIIYNLADFVNKIAFGVVIWACDHRGQRGLISHSHVGLGDPFPRPFVHPREDAPPPVYSDSTPHRSPCRKRRCEGESVFTIPYPFESNSFTSDRISAPIGATMAADPGMASWREITPHNPFF